MQALFVPFGGVLFHLRVMSHAKHFVSWFKQFNCTHLYSQTGGERHSESQMSWCKPNISPSDMNNVCYYTLALW